MSWYQPPSAAEEEDEPADAKELDAQAAGDEPDGQEHVADELEEEEGDVSVIIDGLGGEVRTMAATSRRRTAIMFFQVVPWHGNETRQQSSVVLRAVNGFKIAQRYRIRRVRIRRDEVSNRTPLTPPPS